MHQIITTIGPGSFEKGTIKKLQEVGATDFRINLSHSTKESLEEYFELFEEIQIVPSLDTQGAQLRIAGTPYKNVYDEDERLLISTEQYSDDHKSLKLNHAEVFDQINIGDQIRLDSSGLIVKVLSVNSAKRKAEAVVVSSGTVGSNKAVDIINKNTTLSSLTELDNYAISKYCKRIKNIYHSFTNKADDIDVANNMLDRSIGDTDGKVKPKIIAKIESKAGIANLTDIVPIVDAILIDRGDLSREVSISMIPLACNLILMNCIKMNKPCYVATDILENMLKNPLPSRAEISDLYNLFSKGCSGIVLAAEVAIGKYPVECVHVVKYMSELYKAESTGLHWYMAESKHKERLPTTLSNWL